MLRMLALPAVVLTVLASAACASTSGVQGATETTGPSDGAVSSAAPSTTAGPSTSAPPLASESGQATPDSLYSTDAAMQGDPGVPGLPQSSGASVDDVLRLGAVATWVQQPELIALSLPASSSCWASASEPVVQSSTRILVQVSAPEPCDAPDGARTYSIAVPEGVDASAGLQLEVVGLEHEFTLTLPAG